MTTGEKIANLRKEKNYTQEQLAELLGVSRQSISKYESGISYPETEKLIRLGDVFDCSMDYLLKDEVEERRPISTSVEREEVSTEEIVDSIFRRVTSVSLERKSKRTLFGMPLWHVGKDAKGVIAIGHYFAYGDQAYAMFAVGETKAVGEIFESVKELSGEDKKLMITQMYQKVPKIYHWIVKGIAGLV